MAVLPTATAHSRKVQAMTTFDTFTGGTRKESADWSDASDWSEHRTPLSSDYAVISGYSNAVLDGDGGAVLTLTLRGGADLFLDYATLEVRGGVNDSGNATLFHSDLSVGDALHVGSLNID